jgi:FkbM family methyltransferase
MADLSNFLMRLVEEVCASVPNDFRDNWDERRFGPDPAVRSAASWRSWIRHALHRRGWFRVSGMRNQMLKAVRLVAPSADSFAHVYDMLADDESRQLYVKLLAYRALGCRKVRLPFPVKEQHRLCREIESSVDLSSGRPAGSSDWLYHKVDFSPFGLPMQLFTTIGGAAALLGGLYECVHDETEIAVAAGDTVIDGGGCYGDTAVRFALQAGNGGRVFSFEFVPGNLDLFNQNLALNGELAERIEIIRRALWDRSGCQLSISGKGPASRVCRDDCASQNAETVQTTTIDELVAEKRLGAVDFIKLDIEGAELNALRGAERTLKRFSPKLAVCVYHSLEDFFTIPEYLQSLGLGYRFFLRHFSMHKEETVLFAVTGDQVSGQLT